MELGDLRLFVGVAEAGGFRRASATMGIDQSVVSRRVRLLEDRLGVSLFERSQAGARLTQAGRRFLDSVRQTLGLLDSAVKEAGEAGQAAEGTIRIGVVMSLFSRFLSQLLDAYQGRFPKVRLVFSEGPHERHYAALLDRSQDVAFVTGNAPVEGLDVEQLWTEPVFVALPASDRRSSLPEIGFADIANDTVHVSEAPPGPDTQNYVAKRLSDIGVRPRISRHRVGRAALMSIVGLRQGVALVCGSEVQVAYPGVVFVPLVTDRSPFSAVWHAENDNPALRRLLSDARTLGRSWDGGTARPTATGA